MSKKRADITFLTKTDGYSLRIEAMFGNEEVGTLFLTREQHGIFVVEHMWVDERFQRQGIATEMYQRAVEYARTKKHKVVSVPDARSEAANALHVKLKKTFPHERAMRGLYREEVDVYSNPTDGVVFNVFDKRKEGEGIVITAEGSEEVVGAIELKKTGGEFYVKNLYVEDKYQRKGIATALYEKAVEFARSEGTCVVSEQDMRNAKSDALHAHSLRKKLKHSYRVGKYRNSDVYCNPPSHSFHRIASALGYLLADDGFEFAHKIEAKHCPQADREHADSDRQYCHVGHKKDTICYAKATDDLAIEWKIGLAVHEFGHLILQEGQYYNHGEEEANEAGGQATGIPVDFKGKKHLEWSRCPVWFKEILDGH